MPSYQYAGFWIRTLATVIDSLLWMVVLFVIFLMFFLVGDFAEPEATYTTTDLISSLAFAIFSIGCWVKFAGTPGKRLLKLKVLDAQTGEHVSFMQAVIRYLMYIPSTLVLCLGFFWVAFDAKKQGWHDKVAKTYVVRETK